MSLLKEQSLGAGYVRFSPGGINEYIKNLGDGRLGALNWINNDATPGTWLFHLTTTVNTGGGVMAVGIDGSGTGILLRNKATGIAHRIEQLNTITSPTAYGFSVDHQSSVAPAVFMEQKLAVGGSAPLMQLISYETDATKTLFQYQGANGKGGLIRSADGVLALSADIEGTGAVGFRARSQSTVTAPFRNHAVLAAEEGVGGALTFYNNTGSSGSWWPFRIRGAGSGLLFETAGSSSAIGTFGTATEVMRIRNGQVGWFGAFSAKKTGWGVATGTATRTTFDTTSVTLPQLAEHVKALIDDLHATAGYGLLAT